VAVQGLTRSSSSSWRARPVENKQDLAGQIAGVDQGVLIRVASYWAAGIRPVDHGCPAVAIAIEDLQDTSRDIARVDGSVIVTVSRKARKDLNGAADALARDTLTLRISE
jgi:hypothetical protein